jgi:hypothetical protein
MPQAKNSLDSSLGTRNVNTAFLSSLSLFVFVHAILVFTCVSVYSPEVSRIFDTTLFLFIPICTMFLLLRSVIHLCSLSLPFARFFYISAQSRCPFPLFLYTYTYSRLSFVKLRRSRGSVLSCEMKCDGFVVDILLFDCDLSPSMTRQYQSHTFVIDKKYWWLSSLQQRLNKQNCDDAIRHEEVLLLWQTAEETPATGWIQVDCLRNFLDGWQSVIFAFSDDTLHCSRSR